MPRHLALLLVAIAGNRRQQIASRNQIIVLYALRGSETHVYA